MSNVVIFVDAEGVPAGSLMKLQKCLGIGLGDVRLRIASKNPIFEREIFDGNYDDHSALIRDILSVLETDKLVHRIYELPEGETMESCDFADRCLVSGEVMRNILNQADAELDRQLNE